MSAYFDKTKGRWLFDFDKVINGERVRAVKTLPAGWNRTKAEAYAKAQTDHLYGVATGAIKERVTIKAAVTLYIKYQCPTLKNGNGVIKELARIDWAFDGRYLDELADVAREYTEVERERLAPATIKNKLSYLRAACRYAQKQHGLGAGETFNVSMPAVRNERHNYASRAQMLTIARLITKRHARAAYRIAFYSGMRISEILRCELVDGCFLLQDTKNGDRRMIPIHPRINSCLRYFPFTMQKRGIQRLVENARREADLWHLNFHDMRHSAASAMINNNVDLYTVGAVLGHKDSRSTQRYSHLATNTLAAAIRKIR